MLKCFHRAAVSNFDLWNQIRVDHGRESYLFKSTSDAYMDLRTSHLTFSQPQQRCVHNYIQVNEKIL